MAHTLQQKAQSRIIIALLAVLLMPLFSGCGLTTLSYQTQNVKTQLDSLLIHAAHFGASQQSLTTIKNQENTVITQTEWLETSETQAITTLQTLINSVYTSEYTAFEQNNSAVQLSFASLNNAISQAQSQGIASTYFSAWQTADSQQYTQAINAQELLSVNDHILQQTTIVHTMQNTFNQLTNFSAITAKLSHAGIQSQLAQQEYAQDQLAYAQAKTQNDFFSLSSQINAQIIGLVNDEIQAIPYVGGAQLNVMQKNISLLQSYQQNSAPFQQQWRQDNSALGHIVSLTQFVQFESNVQDQIDNMQLPLTIGKTQKDIVDFSALLRLADAMHLQDYEYHGEFGLQMLQSELSSSQTLQDFQNTDSATALLSENLSEMIANAQTHTPYNQPHTADFTLMHYYGIMSGKVIIISLAEQTMRLYDNGNLVFTTYITTGEQSLPTPPGSWRIISKATNVLFTSPFPEGSKYWYAPTLVHYTLNFHQGGYFIHDAWWRTQFGPGSNLPHYDPNADNNGSHGCVNVPLQQMGLVYEWAALNTPIIIY